MTRSGVALPAAALALCCVAFAACVYPDFQFGTTSAGGGGGATGSGGMDVSSSGMGGMGTSSSSTSGSSGAGGDPCMSTHAAGSECEYYPGLECGCKPGFKCSIANESTGATRCIPFSAGPESRFAKCGDDGSCDKGLWCDHDNSVCKPICKGTNDCNGGQCLPASNGQGTGAIPDLKLCTAYCDPTNVNACGSGATCVHDPNIAELDCIWTLNQAYNTDCMYFNACAPGLACASGKCKHWCPEAGTLNGGAYCAGHIWGLNCIGFMEQVFLNGTEYGVCN